MRIVYIAHPIAGDVEGNIKKIKEIIKRETTDYIYPIAPYLTQIELFGDDHEARESGFRQNREYFCRNIVDELWVYGSSFGVEREMAMARAHGIPIQFLIDLAVGSSHNGRSKREAEKRGGSKRIFRETRSKSFEAK